ncbi:hypothetical protein [Aquibacillus sediminis]|uniref:hypothetical protein n=1 Tax=Aquibacillus sediminis TaxID=2574734 RepID=UPI00110880A2|nr:hypothetical protein [Aquibacillus sediminis]
MKIIWYVIIALAILLAGCGSNEMTTNENTETDDYEEQGQQTDTTNEEESDLQKNKLMEMEIEGTKEEIKVHLHHHDELEFSTYVPEDMLVESDPTSFIAYTNFADQPNRKARLFITKQDKQTIMDDLKAEGFTVTELDSNSYDFSEEELQVSKDGFTGRFIRFSKNNDSYSIGYYYPSEYADGFSARAAVIIDEIVWHH